MSITDTKYPDFPLENIFLALFEDKNISVSDDTIRDITQIFRILSIRYLKLYDGVIELLELLKEKDRNIYLLSNAQRIFTLYEMKLLGIENILMVFAFHLIIMYANQMRNFIISY